MTIVSLDAFRATVRRRARIARLKGVGFATALIAANLAVFLTGFTALIAANLAVFLTGFVVTVVFVALRVFGVVDWSVIWLLLPALIDLGLWFSALRAEALFRAIDSDEEDDDDEGA